MNYISLTHLLELSNTEFSGDAHDPLYDAYNLHILDEVLEKRPRYKKLFNNSRYK